MGSDNTAYIDEDGLHLETLNGLIGASVGIDGLDCEPYMDWTNVRGSGVGVNLYRLNPWGSVAWNNTVTDWKVSTNTTSFAAGTNHNWSALDADDLQNLAVANMSIGSSNGADGAAIVRSITLGDTKYVFGIAPKTTTPVSPIVTTTETEEAEILKPARTGVF